MGDPYVRETGRIEDIDGSVLSVGVDYDTVTLSWPGERRARVAASNPSQADEFAALFLPNAAVLAGGRARAGGRHDG